MAMPPEGTFEYLAIVTEGTQRERPWDVALHTVPADSRGPINEDRLVGHAPVLEIGDRGPDTRRAFLMRRTASVPYRGRA
jgi:hypothetical protein